MTAEETKEAQRLRMVVSRALKQAKDAATDPQAMGVIKKNEAKILALSPKAQREFAIAYEKVGKNLDKAFEVYEKIEKNRLDTLNETTVQPMLHSQIVKELGGNERAAKFYEAWLEQTKLNPIYVYV